MKFKKIAKKFNSGYLAKCKYIKYYEKCKISENTILLESQQGKEYGGNMYYIAKELVENQDYADYNIYMSIRKSKIEKAKKFFKNKGMSKVKFIPMGSKQYYKIISTAKYLFNDNTFLTFFIKKKGQIYLNTWHGTPLKSLGKKIKNDFFNIGNAQRNFLMADYLLYPNEYTRDHMIEDYMLNKLYDNNIILEGYPRNTALLNDKLHVEIRDKYSLQDKEIIAYMPTWRGTLGGQNNNIQELNLKYIFEEMEENLSDNQLLYVNLHPIEKATVDFSEYKKVRPFPAEYETYEFLGIADLLITDYSSVFFDFANTRKKIILYTYDRESYLADRGLYMNLEDLPFPKVNKMKELLKEINTAKNYDDSNFVEKYCKYDEIDSTRRLCSAVIKNKNPNINIEKVNASNKRNVMIFGGSLAFNGITTSLKNLIANIDRTKNNYYIVVDTYAAQKNAEQLYELSQYVDYIAIKGKMNLNLRQKVLMYLHRKHYINTKKYMKIMHKAYIIELERIFPGIRIDDIIHFSGYAYKRTLLFGELPCNKIIYLHSNMYKEATIKKNISLDVLKYAYDKYDKLALVTESLEESTLKITNQNEKFNVVHNLIDYKKILELAKEEVQFDKNTEATITLEELKKVLENKNKKFVTIGRFSKEKGHERLIDAFTKLWYNDNSIYLIIIGGLGTQYKKIIDKINNLECKQNIIIIKYVSNPYAILKQCDYFILSSYYEGFGIVIAEADILGKPVVSTKSGGPEAFMEKYNGILVDNSDDGVYHGLELLYENQVKTMNVDFEEYNKEAIKEFENLLK